MCRDDTITYRFKYSIDSTYIVKLQNSGVGNGAIQLSI